MPPNFWWLDGGLTTEKALPDLQSYRKMVPTDSFSTASLSVNGTASFTLRPLMPNSFNVQFPGQVGQNLAAGSFFFLQSPLSKGLTLDLPALLNFAHSSAAIQLFCPRGVALSPSIPYIPSPRLTHISLSP